MNANGNAVLNKAGTLEGATISGDLIIGDGAAEGDVVLKDVTVSGRLLVRGGGTSTVTLEGNTTVGSVVVNKPTGAVRVENNTEKTVNVNAVSDNVVLTGDFNEVNANAAQGTVTLTGATVATMNVAGTSAKVVVSEKSTVETMNVQGSASGTAVSVQSGTTVKTMNTAASKAVVTVNGTVNTMSVAGSDTTVKAEEGAKIEKITTSAANTTVSGQGSVTNFEAAQGASGADITTSGTKVVNNGTGNVTTGNDKVIASGSTGTSQSDSTTPGGGGSTGGEDEGTPILPVGGIVGVKPVDQSTDGKIPEDQMPNVTASATQDIVSKVVTIKLSTDKVVPLHQNEEKTEGYWVGVAVEVPDDVSEINYYFGTTANATANKKTTPTVDPTIGDKKYFVAFINAGSTTPKTHLTLQWGENKAVQYVIDLSGVKLDMEEATASAVSTYDEAHAPTGITRDEDNELDLTATMSQADVEAFDNAGDSGNPNRRAMVNYIKVTGVASPENIEKVAYSVNRDGEVASAEETVETLRGDGRFVKGEDGSIYLKLGITFAEKKDSTWTKLGTDKYVVTLDFKTSEGATTRASYTLDISKLNITAPATEGGTLPTADDWKFISSFTLNKDYELTEAYEVPAGKTLVIKDGVTLKVKAAITGDGTIKGSVENALPTPNTDNWESGYANADDGSAVSYPATFATMKFEEGGSYGEMGASKTYVYFNEASGWVAVQEKNLTNRTAIGSGQGGSDVSDFNYAEAYKAAGIKLGEDGKTYTVYKQTLEGLYAQEKGEDKLESSEGKLYHLFSPGSQTIYFGMMLDYKPVNAKAAYVYGTDGSFATKLNLEKQEVSSGIGIDLFDSKITMYFKAAAIGEDGQVSYPETTHKTARTIVWVDESGKVLEVTTSEAICALDEGTYPAE